MYKSIAFILFFGLLFSPNIHGSAILSAAQNSARESGKNIFVNYTADWCLPCQIFKEQVLADSKVNNLLASNFIVITADYDETASKSMYADYAIACMPTLHVLDKEGEVLTELSGTMTATQFYDAISQYSLTIPGVPDIAVVENALSRSPKTIISKAPVTKEVTEVLAEYFTLQAGAFSSWENAMNQKKIIEKASSETIWLVEDTERKLYIINVGKYTSIEETTNVSQRLKDARIDHFPKRRKTLVLVR
jgi:thiol-disulfide isomerase/thioredoxin